MKTIAVIGQKGGTGKTNIAQILLVGLERSGFAVAGIDLDPQTSLCTWADARERPTPLVIPMQHSRLSQTLEVAAKDGADFCIIDCAGRAEQAALKAAQAADLVLMPVQPTSADLMTVESTGEIIRMAKSPAAFAILTRVKSQGTRHTEAMEFINGLGFDVCPITIGERVTYQDAAASGQTPQEYDPSGKAALECDNVVKFTREHLNMSTSKQRRKKSA